MGKKKNLLTYNEGLKPHIETTHNTRQHPDNHPEHSSNHAAMLWKKPQKTLNRVTYFTLENPAVSTLKL